MSGSDLLQAIEPMLVEHVSVSKNPAYTSWVLASLRHELELNNKNNPHIDYIDYETKEDDDFEEEFF